MPTPTPRFPKGSKWRDSRPVFNEYAARLDRMGTVAGDGLILVTSTPAGLTIGLNVDGLLERIPHPATENGQWIHFYSPVLSLTTDSGSYTLFIHTNNSAGVGVYGWPTPGGTITKLIGYLWQDGIGGGSVNDLDAGTATITTSGGDSGTHPSVEVNTTTATAIATDGTRVFSSLDVLQVTMTTAGATTASSSSTFVGSAYLEF